MITHDNQKEKAPPGRLSGRAKVKGKKVLKVYSWPRILSTLVHLNIRIFVIAIELLKVQRGQHMIDSRRYNLFGIAAVVSRLCKSESYGRFFVYVYFDVGEIPSFPVISPNFETIPLKKGPQFTIMISYMIG